MLRAVILLLVCMNLGVAAWWTMHRDAPTVRLPANERGVATLKLLSEVESPPSAQAADELNAAALQFVRKLGGKALTTVMEGCRFVPLISG